MVAVALTAAATFAVLGATVSRGVDMYFRVAGWRETRRSSKESA